MNETPLFAPGDLVRFAAPMDAAEAAQRFTVIEIRGPRVLVEAHVDMAIRPQEAHLLDALTGAAA